MAKKSICNMDCFNCIFDDCINDYIGPPEKSAEQKEKHNKYQRQRYQKRKEQGLCVRCGKPATNGLLCYDHWVESTEKNRKRKKTKE